MNYFNPKNSFPFYPFFFSVPTSAPFDAHPLGRNILIALVWISIAQSYPNSHRLFLLFYLPNLIENQLQETR